MTRKTERPAFFAFMLFITASFFISSCNKFDDIEKYQQPEWLVGKVYSQIAKNPELSLFAKWIEDVGYDTIVDKTGTYTIFAPTNTAVESYLAGNGLTSADDLSQEQKERLVKFHIIQMPWNRDQLQGLSAKGWINMNDRFNNKPFAFKRQTLLRNDNQKYPVRVVREGELTFETIVPEGESDDFRTVYTNSRKYVPIYFDGFLSAAKLNSEDYAFYFNRDYEPGNIFFADAKVIGEDIYADNGFVYRVDKVVDPLLNVEELMDQGTDEEAYSDFKNLVYLNSDFNENNAATMAQEGADQGLEVDQLYNLTYPELGFGIHQELTTNPGNSNAANLTTEYHNGIIVPTNTAFQEFVQTVLTGSGRWPNLDDIPANVKKLLVNSHMAEQPIYLQDVTNGFFNANGDFIGIDPSIIIQKSFGSNATFLGVNEVITPKAFTTVSAPLYLNPNYQTFLAAFELSGLLPAMKQDDLNYSLFIVSDITLAGDESLEIRWKDWKKERFDLIGLDRSFDPPRYNVRSASEITNTMFGQIAIEPLNGLARLEFLETLDGRHLIVNNEDQTLTGGNYSVFGYKGDSAIVLNYNEISGQFNNGKVYDLTGWPRFATIDLHTRLSGSKFLSLLIEAGMADRYAMTFTNPADRYTVFFPSDEALDAVQADTLTGDQLTAFLKLFFIKNDLIFTDGRKSPGLFPTMSKLETGNGYQYRQLNLSPGIDEIALLNSDGTIYYRIEESPAGSNLICARKTSNAQTGEDVYSTEAVVHRIDTVLIAY